MQLRFPSWYIAVLVRISLLLVDICYERGMYLQIVDAPVIYARPRFFPVLSSLRDRSLS
jgi:hypothetical protein